MKDIIELSIAAQELHQEKTKEIETYFREDGQFSEIKDWGAKFIGNTLRIAGVIHVAMYPKSFKKEKISKETLEKAYAVGQYLIPHARLAYGLVSDNQDIVYAKRVLNWIQKNKFSSFSKNACHSRFKNSLQTAAQVSKILQILVERNYIKEFPNLTLQVGRPSQVFQVNPKVI